MIQGVRDVFEIVDLNGGDKKTDEEKSKDSTNGKLVLIGRGLDQSSFGPSLKTALEG